MQVRLNNAFYSNLSNITFQKKKREKEIAYQPNLQEQKVTAGIKKYASKAFTIALGSMFIYFAAKRVFKINRNIHKRLSQEEAERIMREFERTHVWD